MGGGPEHRPAEEARPRDPALAGGDGAGGCGCPLSLDTTNLAAIEAACEVIKHQPIINSTSAEPERLEKVPLVAKVRHEADWPDDGSEGIPVSADARVNIALEKLFPRCDEVGLPLST